jgi:hypothetical protein
VPGQRSLPFFTHFDGYQVADEVGQGGVATNSAHNLWEAIFVVVGEIMGTH